MKFKYIIWCFVAALCLVSCKEEDDTPEEYPDWQARNDTYFLGLVEDVKANKYYGNWVLMEGYTKPDHDYAYQYYDYVVVEKLENGPGTTSPLSTDTVEVHYAGHLLPSADKYKQSGYEFDRTYSDPFDPVLATPVKMGMRSISVVGFATALMKRHRGDHWRLYIPYQLAYGTSTQGTIPAYSTLIFDLRLVDFWRKEQGDRE